MPVQLKVKDMMVSIDDYAVTTADKPLKEAVPELMKIYCQVETGKCTEAGHRTSLVLDAKGELLGILDFKSILKVLIPEIAGGISGKLRALGVSIAFAEADAHDMDHAKHTLKTMLETLCLK
jgi:uncharacterized membrane protein